MSYENYKQKQNIALKGEAFQPLSLANWEMLWDEFEDV